MDIFGLHKHEFLRHLDLIKTDCFLHTTLNAPLSSINEVQKCFLP